jgi:hypothetical protein
VDLDLLRIQIGGPFAISNDTIACV